MGSKSKSRNNSTSTNAAQMAALQKANPAITMEQAMGNQQAMQSDMLGKVLPIFDGMMQNGMSVFNSNPMGGGAPAPANLTDILSSLLPAEGMASYPQMQPQPQQPSAPFGQMSEAEIDMIRQNMPKRYGFGGVK